MGRRDVQEYFVSMQKQYNAMLKSLEKVNKEISEGLITEEQRSNFENYFNIIKCNYDRISYIYHLLCLPPKFIQRLQENKIKKQHEKFLKSLENASKEDVIKENEEALDSINKEFDDIKNNSSEGEEAVNGD